VEGPRQIVVATTREGANAVDGVRVGPSEHDHWNVPGAAAKLERQRVRSQHEIGPGLLRELQSLAVHGFDVEPVLTQMALQEAACRGLRLGEKQRARHAAKLPTPPEPA
jgi:hypothetical protein